MKRNDLNEQLLDAVKTRWWEETTRLLGRGADPNARYADGDTGLMRAARNGDHRTLCALLCYKADIDAQNTYNGKTALMYSIDDYWTTAKLLRDNGARTDITDKDGRVALSLAVLHHPYDKTLRHILTGPGMHIPDNTGKSAKDYIHEDKVWLDKQIEKYEATDPAQIIIDAISSLASRFRRAIARKKPAAQKPRPQQP